MMWTEDRLVYMIYLYIVYIISYINLLLPSVQVYRGEREGINHLSNIAFVYIVLL